MSQRLHLPEGLQDRPAGRSARWGPAIPEDLETLFPQIADYAFLSDCENTCLVAPTGAVEWLCLPRPHDPSVFGTILDRSAGSFRIRARGQRGAGAPPVRPGHDVAHDDLADQERVARGHRLPRDRPVVPGGCPVRAAPAHPGRRRRPPRAPAHRDVSPRERRRPPELRALVRVRAASTRAGSTSATATTTSRRPTTASSRSRSRASLRLGIEGRSVHARHRLSEGESTFVALRWTDDPAPTTLEEVDVWRAETNRFWRGWIDRGRFPDHPWREHVQRSALTLKGLTYTPTGALLAAPTTSLPEHPGGQRNWDYRYTWVRDSAFDPLGAARARLRDRGGRLPRVPGRRARAPGHRQRAAPAPPAPPGPLPRRRVAAARRDRARPPHAGTPVAARCAWRTPRRARTSSTSSGRSSTACSSTRSPATRCASEPGGSSSRRWRPRSSAGG